MLSEGKMPSKPGASRGGWQPRDSLRRHDSKEKTRGGGIAQHESRGRGGKTRGGGNAQHEGPQSSYTDSLIYSKILRAENAKWNARYFGVRELIKFVRDNLLEEKWAGESNRKRKAAQYVHMHFIAGRLSDKTDDRIDPLFCVNKQDHSKLDHFNDPVLKENLSSENYKSFQEKEQIFYEMVSEDEDPPEVSWDYILEKSDLYPLSQRAKEMLKRLQDEQYRQLGIKEDFPELGQALGENEVVVEKMIGLTLRYLCIGGFDDAIHTSLPDMYKAHFSDCVECFTTPFTHKLDKWYSYFEEDKIFGSKGNFFSECAKNGGKIPRDVTILGSANNIAPFLEMQPIWCISVYDHLAKILQNSADEGVKAIIIGPDWDDKKDARRQRYVGQTNKWINDLNELVKHEKYAQYSIHGNQKNFPFEVDGKPVTKNVLYWVFSEDQIPQHIIKGTKDFQPDTGAAGANLIAQNQGNLDKRHVISLELAAQRSLEYVKTPGVKAMLDGLDFPERPGNLWGSGSD